MTNSEIMQIVFESSKKSNNLSQKVSFLSSNTIFEFCKAEDDLRHAIQDILQLFPEQSMREYMLKFCINSICNDVDILADVLKALLRKNLGCIDCVIEESQTKEAE